MAGYDYHLTGGSAAIGAATNPGSSFDGYSLTPTQEYVYNSNTQTRSTATDDGALAATIGVIQDPGFEAGSALSPYWTAQGTADFINVDTTLANAHAGSNSGQIVDSDHTGNFVDIAQSVAVQANTNYTLTAWLNGSGMQQPLLGIMTSAGKIIADVGLNNSTSYQQYKIVFDSCSNTSISVFAGYTTPGSASSMHMDDFALTTGGTPPQLHAGKAARCHIR
jgi:hypothetical protein